MNNLFEQLLNNTNTVSVLIIAVIAVRFLFKGMPKKIICLLWGVVMVKLVLPFQIESPFSMIPHRESVLPDLISGINALSGTEVANTERIASDASTQLALGTTVNTSFYQVFMQVMTIFWIVGIVVLFVYSTVSYLTLRRKVSASIKVDKKIYECDYIDGPFILGIIRPRIYYPSTLSDETKRCVIKHENTHLKRMDHVWKPLAFMILIVYWFNPFCWIAYSLFVRDIEYACDEQAAADESKSWRAEYCQALLNCSAPKKMIAGCPVAFGENSVKGRVKSIMKYKKPGLGIVLASISVCAVVAVCFATSQKSSASDQISTHTVESEMYSEADIESAIEVIETEFEREWHGCTLTEIYYAGDDMTRSASVEGYASRYDADDVIVLLSTFDVDSSGGDGSLNADSTYEYFNWILVRKKGGRWQHVDHGY